MAPKNRWWTKQNMKGFFSLEEAQSFQKSSKISTTPSCGVCGLYKKCINPKMPVTGEGRKGIMIIAEAPGADEDKHNIQLIGKAGQKLRSILKALGVDLDRDCWKTNACCCRPVGNQTPTPSQIESCRPNVLKAVKEHHPKLVLLLGWSALESYYGYRWKEKMGGIGKWRGWNIPDHTVTCWVSATYHPSFIERNKQKGNKTDISEVIWIQDIKKALSVVGKELPEKVTTDQVIVLKKEREINELLETILQLKPLTAFDYETTGLKPHAKGHRIVSVSVCFNNKNAYSWMMTDETKEYFVQFLKNPDIPKIASNMKFEHSWGRQILKTKTKGWAFDTMLASHILDNRSGITSIKFQSFVRLGVDNYNSHLSHLLEADGGGNSFNKIDQIPEQDLLVYNGMDSLLEYKVAMQQIKEIGLKIKLSK